MSEYSRGESHPPESVDTRRATTSRPCSSMTSKSLAQVAARRHGIAIGQHGGASLQRRKRTSHLGIVSAFGALAVVALVGSALPLTALADEGREEAFRIDAERISKATGDPYGQVLAQLRTQVALNEPLTVLEEENPDFGSGYWKDGELYVQFKGDVPSATIKALRQKSDSPLHGKNVKYSLSDLRTMQKELEAGLRAAEVEQWTTGIDPETQRVDATVRAAGAAERVGVNSQVSQRLPRDAYQISFTDEPVVLKRYGIYGGAEMRFNGNVWCTTGFSVQDLRQPPLRLGDPHAHRAGGTPRTMG